MREVRIPAFAKINLRLDILGKRSDGYHELRTIFQSVSLHDELRLRASRQQRISLSIQGNSVLSQEPIQKNLVYRAVDALRHELKIRAGVEIELKKTIPAGRGLGGGSSDAAAALLGFLHLTVRQPRRRNLPSARHSEAFRAHRFASRHSRPHTRRLSLAASSPLDIDKRDRRP